MCPSHHYRRCDIEALRALQWLLNELLFSSVDRKDEGCLLTRFLQHGRSTGASDRSVQSMLRHTGRRAAPATVSLSLSPVFLSPALVSIPQVKDSMWLSRTVCLPFIKHLFSSYLPYSVFRSASASTEWWLMLLGSIQRKNINKNKQLKINKVSREQETAKPNINIEK